MSICCFYMRILLIYACYLEPCINGPMPWLYRLILSTFQVLCVCVTIVEQDPYLTYLDDPWTPTADGQNIR